MRRLSALVLVALSVSVNVAAQEVRPTAREGAEHAVPLYGDLLRTWDAPDDDPFAAGHRGVDVAAERGAPVRASADGVVVFAGSVAGNRSVTIDHGDNIRTTYSFLAAALVAKNAHVTLGTTIGTVGDGHATNQRSHVHLSAREGERYFDPIALYLGSDVAGLVTLTG